MRNEFLLRQHPEVFQNITPEGVINIHRQIWSYAERNRTKYKAPFERELAMWNHCVACAVADVLVVSEGCSQCPINWSPGLCFNQDCSENLYNDWLEAEADKEREG